MSLYSLWMSQNIYIYFDVMYVGELEMGDQTTLYVTNVSHIAYPMTNRSTYYSAAHDDSYRAHKGEKSNREE